MKVQTHKKPLCKLIEYSLQSGSLNYMGAPLKLYIDKVVENDRSEDMTRLARLDTPGGLHHIMIRGLS